MKKIISSLILLAICFVTLPQALADTPISCSDILRQGLSLGDGEYLVDPDGSGGNEAFEVYCDMTNGGWQLIYNRNNAYFTPDHMVQSYPTGPINFDLNSTSWFIPPDAGLWRWEISVDGGELWRGITTAIPDEAFGVTHGTIIDVLVSLVSDNTLGSSEPFYYQTFTLDDQCLFNCDSGSATWWGIVNVLQGAGDQDNPGIGGHSDSCALDDSSVAGDNYTWGDGNLEIYLSDFKDIQGNGIGGTNCLPDGPTDLYRYRFWARMPPLTEVPFDIKPGSCPNPLNVKSKGVLPAAIMGTDDFDVTTIDPSSLKLRLKGTEDDGVSPLRWALSDVGEPFEPYIGKEDCFEDCNDFGPDGYMDLKLKFNKQEVVADLGEVNDEDCLVLEITGDLMEEYGGTPIIGEDVLRILKKGKK
jgi:hypothetical protein